nr:hypothetical protein [Cohnella rhizosphaerae]
MEISLPSMEIRPLVGSTSRLIIFIVVDLPHPLGPISVTSSPSAISRSMPFKALVPSGYFLVTPSNVIKRVRSPPFARPSER